MNRSLKERVYNEFACAKANAVPRGEDPTDRLYRERAETMAVAVALVDLASDPNCPTVYALAMEALAERLITRSLW